MLDNGNQAVCDNCNIDLSSHHIFGIAPKGRYPEILFNPSVEAALQQIEEKGYARRFADDKCRLFKIGVRFSTANRCIDSWKLADNR